MAACSGACSLRGQTNDHVNAVVAGAWHVLDFGLARKFVDDDGTVIPQRDRKEFRGSTSYASVAAHKLEDLGTKPWCTVHCVDESLPCTKAWL